MTAQFPEPTLELTRDGYQLWSVGRVAVLMPALQEHWPDRLKAAWRRRLLANATFVCACGGTGSGSVATGYGSVEHESDCDAMDERFLALLEDAA